MNALLGFGQNATESMRYRPEAWTPLTVFLTGQSERGAAQLRVIVHAGGRITTTERRLRLPDGAIRQTADFVINLHPLFSPAVSASPPDAARVDIELLADGRRLAYRQAAFPPPIDPAAYTVLALTRDRSGLNFLTRKNLRLTHRRTALALPPFPSPADAENKDEQNKNLAAVPLPDAALCLLYGDVQTLPVGAQGYEAIDAVAFADMPFDSLTEAQTEAIKGYVRSGGLLIVSGGNNPARLRSPFFADLLPVTPTGVTTVRSLPVLEQRYHAPLDLTTRVSLTTGALKSGAYALLTDKDRAAPLVSVLPYGAGRVAFTSFDYLDTVLRDWKAAPALWRDLLQTGNAALSPRDLLASSGEGVSPASLRLEDALAGKQAGSVPDVGVVGAFLAVYIVLLVPVNYALLKRLDRREWAWASIPLLIVGFTLAAYRMAVRVKGGQISVNRAVIVETTANSDQAAAYGQISLYSPARAAYDVAFTSPGADLRACLPGEAYASDTNAGLTIESENESGAGNTAAGGSEGAYPSALIRGAQIGRWDKRSFELSFPAAIGRGIAARTRLLPDGLVMVEVTNQTPYTLRDCVLTGEGQSVLIGDLAPGQSGRPQKIRWNLRSDAANLPFLLPSAPDGSAANLLNGNERLNNKEQLNGKEQAAWRLLPTRGQIRLALAIVLSANAGRNALEPSGAFQEQQEQTGGRQGVNAFCGWFYDPLLQPHVNGQPAPQGDEVNLLVAHLPPPANGGPALRAANPFAAPPILEFQDAVREEQNRR